MKKSKISTGGIFLCYTFLIILLTFSTKVHSRDNSNSTASKVDTTIETSSIWDRLKNYVMDVVAENSSGESQSKITSNFDCAPVPKALIDVRAIASGRWNSAKTWQGGRIPADGDVVTIPQNINVTLAHRDQARLQYVNVQGTLTMAQRTNTRLMTETLRIAASGKLLIGRSWRPLGSNVISEIVFLDNGVISNPTLSNRGLIVDGQCSIFGQPKTPFVNASDVRAGQTSIQVTSIGDFWRVGDELVVPGTTFNPGNLSLVLTGNELSENRKPSRAQIANAFTDEKVTITGIQGNTITFTPALRFDHVRPKTSLPFHVANLSRNIIFRSESNTVARRGHTMFMEGSSVYIQGARFYQLGRTDKRIPLDDFEVAGRNTPGASRGQARRKSNPSSIRNNRGRYAVHFHRNGVNEDDVNVALATVTNSVVEDTPGWGYVNHSSHVDFTDNVAFNFTGAGFVTEIGDELGTFDGNIAIQGHGNGELRERRLGFKMNSRLPVINDLGFGGDGFWFQGPAVRANNNVAVSCNGSGMIWFTTGGVQDARINNQWTHGVFVGMRESIARKVYPNFGTVIRPRQIVEGYQNADERVYLLVDFPLLECDNNTFYASHIGFNIRFNNSDSNAFFRQGPYNQHFNRNNLQRAKQYVSNQVLWNNYMAINSSYTSKTEFNNIEIYNAQRRRYSNDYSVKDFGIQGEHASNLTFNNMQLEGYGLGALLQRRNSVINNQEQIVNTATVAVKNQIGNQKCDMVNVRSTVWRNNRTIRVSFNTDNKQQRIAIRYKATDEFHWVYRNFTTTNATIDLNGLNGNKTYQYQLLRGCFNAVSNSWSETQNVAPNTNKNNDGIQGTTIRLFPNPASSVIYFNIDELNQNGIQRILFYDVKGKKIALKMESSGLDMSELDVSSFSEGFYVVELVLDNGDMITKKVMIKR